MWTSFRMSRVFIRRLSYYKKVPRPDEFKLVSRKEYVPPSLAQHLAMRVKSGGPITVADYMRTVLTHPSLGYYTRGDVFGKHGDFITSPDISPLFGEMIGIWACYEFSRIGSPRPLQIVELGPGRGALVSNIVRVFSQLPPGEKDVSVHLVEVSQRLAQAQAQRLSVTDLTTNLSESTLYYQHGRTDSGLEVFWYRNLNNVPRSFSFFVAHEFFDALPIHKFQKVENDWREILITTKDPNNLKDPQFDFVLSGKKNAPHSLLISKDEKRDHVEVCPEAADIADQLAERLETDGGIALIVDYGHSGEKTDTFRAFKQHELFDPLEAPGTADLTADVDFSFLQRTVGDRVFAVGPVSQSLFLKRMGIETRLKAVLPNVTEEEGTNLKSGVKMVVEDMGERFKFMAMFPSILKEDLLKYPVSGFHDLQRSEKT